MDKGKATALLFRAVYRGNFADAQAALAAGANINDKEPGFHDTPLHLAVGAGHAALAAFLIENGADVNANNTFRQTSLHRAVSSHQHALVGLLIERGADITLKDEDGHSPKQLAEMLEYAELVQLLADVAKQRQGHADRVTGDRKDKGPPQVGG